MRSTALLAATFLSICNSSFAEDTFGGTYICLDEFGGGLNYDTATQRWQSTTFTPNGRFALKLSFVSERPDDLWEHLEFYSAAVSMIGGDGLSFECEWGGSKTIAVLPFGAFWCYAGFSTYRFNLKELRYTTSYQHGYVDGQDNNDNTPSMMGGSCAKVD